MTLTAIFYLRCALTCRHLSRTYLHRPQRRKAGSLVVLGAVGVGAVALVLAGTAFLGAYTTFSTWMLETDRVLEDGLRTTAGLYVAVSLVGGLACAGAGWALAAAF